MTGTEIRSIEGDTVDGICFRYYGRTAGVTEQVLQQNPGLASKGPFYPPARALHCPRPHSNLPNHK